MSERTEALKAYYRMKRHVEGGCFAEVYTAADTHEGRPLAGSIYYLLDAGDVCVFHQLDCDELYYYHEGCGMKLTVLSGGERREILLGARSSSARTRRPGRGRASCSRRAASSRRRTASPAATRSSPA